MRSVSLLLISVLMMLLSGCAFKSSAESEYYMLASAPLPHKQSDPDDELIIVGPITMANYLKRASIVTRVSDHEYDISKLEQWGGNLDGEFQMALVKNLSALDTNRMYIRYPGMVSVKGDYSLRMDVLRFDAESSGRARLEASWGWIDKQGLIFAGGNFSKTKTSGRTIESMVAAQSELLKELSEEVLRALQGSKP